MIIGIDASRANREHKTGTEWYSYYLIRWLAKLDPKNQYILYTDKPLKNGLLNLGTTQYYPGREDEKPLMDKDGFQTVKSPYNNFKAKVLGWPFKFFWTQGRLSLEMLLHKVDLLFVPAHTLPVIHPQRSVITIHDIGFEKSSGLYQKEHIVDQQKNTNIILDLLVNIFTAGRYGANNIDYLHWSTNFGLKNSQRVIAVSNYTKKELIETYEADPAKIQVIYNGYNRDLFKHIDDTQKIGAVLRKYGISRPYLFYVGRIEKKKNIPALIEAFSIFKQKNRHLEHKLVLTGNASFGYDETKYMIEEFGLESEVIMTGWAEEYDLPYLYSGAEAFVFPSIYEGFGIPLLQAMACRIPIACSDATSIPEIVGGNAVFFNPHHTQSIAHALQEVIENTGLRNRIVQGGSDRVKAFGWHKCAQETLELFKSI